MDINSVTWNRFATQEKVVEATQYVEMPITLVPDWNVSMFLSWDQPPHPTNPDTSLLNVQYMIYSSGSELGPFDEITAQPITDTQFLALDVRGDDRRTHDLYWVVETLFSDGVKLRSYPQSPGVNFPRWHLLRHRDIARRENILLEKFVGVDSIIWVPKTHGLRCKVCWSDVHKKVMNDHCETCYGTGFEGGYNTGMRTLFQYTSIDPVLRDTYYGASESTTISAWTTFFPLVPPHSIICRMPDRRVFRVEGHQGSTELLTNMQRQTVVLNELSRDAIENKLFNNANWLQVLPRPTHVHHPETTDVTD